MASTQALVRPSPDVTVPQAGAVLAPVPTAVANEVVSWISPGNGPTNSAPA